MISQSRICKQAACCRLSPEHLLVLFCFPAAECFQNLFQMLCASGIFVSGIQPDPDGCCTRAGINADDVICIDILLAGVYECRHFASLSGSFLLPGSLTGRRGCRCFFLPARQVREDRASGFIFIGLHQGLQFRVGHFSGLTTPGGSSGFINAGLHRTGKPGRTILGELHPDAFPELIIVNHLWRNHKGFPGTGISLIRI